MWLLLRVRCNENYSYVNVEPYFFKAENRDEVRDIVIQKMKDDNIREEYIQTFRKGFCERDITKENRACVWTDLSDYTEYKFCRVDDVGFLNFDKALRDKLRNQN